ncbi:FUSC family protein [Streptomyces castrisilvae]|uniref:FUSC family protein n=1 Tax=Streptomyces castrisilvae TaxID=3033811 RepID=A0ABY9HJ89_9ACTN|nr:FUSC family protein [Streptomyces sp. Mut1]WLQ34611.1 FUSC family protein [Streptomyces sp. Mut1]
MSWLRALRETARSGLTIERRRLEPLIALRGAAGLALVIGVSLALFGPVVAASSAFGAFQAAIATFQRSWRPRPVLALISGVSLGLSTFIGYVTGSHLPLFLVLLVLWTFLAGLAWAAGPTGGIIAASNVAIMLVTITLPTSVGQAALHAAMIVFGGIVQAALIVLLPIRRWGPQRDALADALAAEADYARRLRHDPVAHFDPVPLMHARRAAAVTPREARRRPAELHGSRGIAERIRPVLASLADPAMGVPSEGPERDRVRELLAAAGSVLDAAARAIRNGDPVKLPGPAVAALRTPDTGALLTGPPLRAADRLAALLSDVIEAAEGDGTREERAGAEEAADAINAGRPAAPHQQRPTLLRLVPVVIGAMRREVHHGSPILRHAVRIAAVAAVGYLLGRALPFGHGYWAPLAAVMVMRPEFSQTYARSAARFVGTVVGVFLATAIVQAAHPGPGLSAVFAVACALLMYLLMRTGYAVGQACVAAYVVFLLGMAGDDWSQTVFERVLLTLVGGLLAMISYAVYPAWETPRLRGRLSDWLKAGGRYAAAVVDQYADPAERGDDEVRRTLLATREARVAWQEAVAAAQHEPVRHRGLSRGAADATQHALAQLGRVAMLMEAHLPGRGATPVPGAGPLAEALRRATDRGAKAVRERRVPDWTPVREALERWEEENRAAAGEPGEPGDAVREAGGAEPEPPAPYPPESKPPAPQDAEPEPPAPQDAEPEPPAPYPAEPEPPAPQDAEPEPPAPHAADPVLRNSTRLLLEALEDFSRGLTP